MTSIEKIRAQVVASRRAQGLPDHVTAETFLDRLAAEVLAEEVAADAA
jgi:hypothetical protein